MRSSRLDPASSGSDLTYSLAGSTAGANWSHRAYSRTSDLIATGEGFRNDPATKPNRTTTGNKTTNRPPVRSYIQTKVGSRRSHRKDDGGRKREVNEGSGERGVTDRDRETKQQEDENQADTQNNQNPAVNDAEVKVSPEDAVAEANSVTEKSSTLERYVDKADLELFKSSRQHLDAINLSTQLQQTVCEEMRTQAQRGQHLCDSMKSQALRLQKTSEIPINNADQMWVTDAFDHLRKVISEQAHAHRVYSLTLLSQSSAIQQSLDSHRDAMDISKQAPPINQDEKTSQSSGVKVGGMTFLQATQMFEAARRPRLKLLSEVDYLTEQVASLEHQVKDAETLLRGLREAQDADQSAWRLQHKIEEARTRQDCLSTRHAQLKSELRKSCAELTTFHQRHREKMAEVVEVFRQHRLRCDSTLSKSLSLLRASLTEDKDILKKLDSHQDKWLNMDETQPSDKQHESSRDTEPSRDIEGDQCLNRSPSILLKRRSPTKNKNPLKTRKVCFGETRYSDIDLAPCSRDNDASSNNSSPHCGSESERLMMEKDDIKNVRPPTDNKQDIARECLTRLKFSKDFIGDREDGQEFALGDKDSGKGPERDKLSSPFMIKETMLKDAWADIESSRKNDTYETDRVEIVSPSEMPQHSGSSSPTKEQEHNNVPPYLKLQKECRYNGERMPSSKPKLKTIAHNTETPTHMTKQVSGESMSLLKRHNVGSRASKSPVKGLHDESKARSLSRQDQKVNRSGTPIRNKPKRNDKTNCSNNDFNKGVCVNDNKIDDGQCEEGEGVKESQRNVSPARTESDISCSLDQSISRVSDDGSPDTTIFLSTKPQASRTKVPPDEEQEEHEEDVRSDSSDAATVYSSDVETEMPAQKPVTKPSRRPKLEMGRLEQDLEATSPTRQSRDGSSDDDSDVRASQNKHEELHISGDEEKTKSAETATQQHQGREVAKRRVAFCGDDRQDKRDSQQLSRESESPSGKTAKSERGILKKSNNRNPTSKSAVIKEDREEISGRIVKTRKSSLMSAAGSKSPIRYSDRTDGLTYRGRFMLYDRESEIASSPEQSPRHPQQYVDVEESVSEIMRAKNRLEMDEEDRIHRLIRKYSHRGISTLSKNFNNSDTTMLTCAMFSGRGGWAEGVQVGMVGQADRLEFDGDSGRRVKVCAVRPISTHACDGDTRYYSQRKTPQSQCNTSLSKSTDLVGTNTSDNTSSGLGVDHTRKLSSHISHLRQFEVTAGKFVESTKATHTDVDSHSDDTMPNDLTVGEAKPGHPVYSQGKHENTNEHLKRSKVFAGEPTHGPAQLLHPKDQADHANTVPRQTHQVYADSDEFSSEMSPKLALISRNINVIANNLRLHSTPLTYIYQTTPPSVRSKLLKSCLKKTTNNDNSHTSTTITLPSKRASSPSGLDHNKSTSHDYEYVHTENARGGLELDDSEVYQPVCEKRNDSVCDETAERRRRVHFSEILRYSDECGDDHRQTELSVFPVDSFTMYSDSESNNDDETGEIDSNNSNFSPTAPRGVITMSAVIIFIDMGRTS